VKNYKIMVKKQSENPAKTKRRSFGIRT